MVQLSMSFLVLAWSGSVAAVVDLNPQEIQFVADHLTYHKCLELIDALNQNGFWLKETEKDEYIDDESSSTSPFPQSVRPDADRPCVVQLTNWCEGPGQDMTFDIVALRLREIGLKEVAEKLSKKVLHETSEQLHRFFLDDPFKDMIPPKSVMVDKPAREEVTAPAPDLEDKQENLFVAVVILGTICATFCLCVGICMGCPDYGRQVCKGACPAMCSACFEIGLNNCGRFYSGVKMSANKHLFMAPKGDGGGPFLL